MILPKGFFGQVSYLSSPTPLVIVLGEKKRTKKKSFTRDLESVSCIDLYTYLHN